MKRILIIISNFNGVGGAEKATQRFLSKIDKNSFDMDVCFLSYEDEFVLSFKENVSNIFCFDIKKDGYVKTYFKLLKLLKKKQYEIIHTHLGLADLYGLSLALVTPVKWISTEHNLSDRRKATGMGKIYYRLVKRKVYRIVGVSSQVINWLKKAGIPSEKLVLIPNPIEIVEKSLDVTQKTNFIRACGWPDKVKIIGAVANLRPIKGHMHKIRHGFNSLPRAYKFSKGRSEQIKKKAWCIIFLSVSLIPIALLVLIFRTPWPKLAKLLVVNDQPVKVDVLITLGGDSDREIYAAELYRLNLAPTIIMSGCGSSAAQMAARAIQLGVKPQDIILEEKSENTYQNAVYSREIVLKHNFKSAIIVTSPYHMRRAKLVFDRVFRNTGVKLFYCSTKNSGFNVDGQCQSQIDRQIVQREYIKLIYYWIRYWG